MSITVGRFTLTGTDAQNEAMRPFAEQATALLGDRLPQITVRVVPRPQMPRYRAPRPGDKPSDGHAEGYWRSVPNVMLIADDVIGRDDLEETMGHECIHALFETLPPKSKKALLPYLSPQPANYSDTQINGDDKGYPALPEECIATWGSAALFGFAWPAYKDLYKRRIAETSYPDVKTLLMSGPLIGEPTPPPPDCQALLDAANAKIAQLNGVLDQIHELSAPSA